MIKTFPYIDIKERALLKKQNQQLLPIRSFQVFISNLLNKLIKINKKSAIHYSLLNIKYTEKVEIQLSIFMATDYSFSKEKKRVECMIRKFEFSIYKNLLLKVRKQDNNHIS